LYGMFSIERIYSCYFFHEFHFGNRGCYNVIDEFLSSVSFFVSMSQRKCGQRSLSQVILNLEIMIAAGTFWRRPISVATVKNSTN
jgi:hypothetical protein